MKRTNRLAAKKQVALPGYGTMAPHLASLGEGVRPRAPLVAAGLFAGIGGLELGLENQGHRTRVMCEIDPGAKAVLEKRFQGIPIESDVRELSTLPEQVDLVTAGFPCQDLSQAGKTLGITGAQSSLIGQVFRLLRKRRVPWLLIENVPFMLQLGRGRALELIVDELEHLGYRWAYRVVDSRSFGLPQRRHRVFLVASLADDPRDVLLADDAGDYQEQNATLSRSFGFYWTEGSRGLGKAVNGVPTLKGGSSVGIPSPPAIVLPRRGRIITPDIRDAERLQGFEPDWTLPAQEMTRRVGSRWKLVGNAVTVHVAEWLGFRLRAPGRYDPEGDRALVRKSSWPQCAWNIGDGRYMASVSRSPIAFEPKPIHEFLEFERKNLSWKATNGFLKRLRASSLRRPPWFDEALETHLGRTSKD